MSGSENTLKVCEFRPRSSSEGPAQTREGDSQLVITKHFSKVSMDEHSEEEMKIHNNNNFLKCPTLKKMTSSRSNPQLGAVEKTDSPKHDRPLVSRGTVLKLMDIPPPDYDQIRRSLSPCRLSPEVQSLVDNF